jgi:PIN domain nuclease of toxin-antitoxin system
LRLLLDTHVLIWWSGGRPIAPAAAAAIRSPLNDVLVSAATVWEAEIKAAAGKLNLDVDLPREPAEHGFRELDITSTHCVAAARLPRHHGDPFDRMLVAQAQLENLTLVTRDAAFRPYRVQLLAA